MSTAIIKKTSLSGTVQAPSSKSVAHRMLLCAALSRSCCTINNISDSDDMTATIGCLEALGAKIAKNGSTVFIDATDFALNSNEKHYTLNCKESGTTLRIMIPVCAALGLHVTFVGENRLVSRPLDEYVELLPQHGVSITKGDTSLPFTIKGQLCGSDFFVSPTVSSQYVTGLIFALSLLENDSVLHLKSELVGSQYVDITTSVIKSFGVNVTKADNAYMIKGSQKYTNSENLNVEGDWSQAAFFLCCGAIGSDITVTNLEVNSTQGDKKIIEYLKSFGAEVVIKGNTVSTKKSKLKATDIDATDTPDLVPILSVLASFCDGDTNIYGVNRLKYKESDRLLSTSQMINSLGGNATYTDDCMTIKGVGTLNGGTVDGFNDHRIVMSSAIAGAFCNNDTTITDANAVNKSYTNFFDDYKSLGGICDVVMG